MPAHAERLGEKEFALLNEITKHPTITQRRLSQSVDLSLGMTNLLIKRLARKGFIKVSKLDWKRSRYLLTLDGAAEKSRKAYDYTRYTWRIFRQILDNIEAVLRREYDLGRREFWLVAQDEILDLLKEEIDALDMGDARFTFAGAFADLPASADLILTASLTPPPVDGGERRRFIRLVDFDNIDFRVS